LQNTSFSNFGFKPAQTNSSRSIKKIEFYSILMGT